MKSAFLILPLLLCAVPASAARTSGTYTVPAGYGLEEPLDVLLSRARLQVDGNHVTFDYRLPMELDGASPQRFRLAGTVEGETLILNDTRGDAVTAECTAFAEAFRCAMKYKQPFTVDQAGALAYLQARGASSADIEKLQRGSDSLQHQAAGIVTIPRG